MRHLVFVIGLCVSALVSGCATILHGTTQEVSVSSDPTGATVTTGALKTTTPGKLELKRHTGHLLTFTKEGYQSKTAKLASVESAAVGWNYVGGGGPFGFWVDRTTGGDSRLVPESIHVRLKPIELVPVQIMGPPERSPAIPQQVIPTAVTEGANAGKVDQPTIELRLKTLKELRNKQLITPEQYEKATQEVLKAVTE